MTFAARLLQAIVAVVVITTVATLFIAQRQNSATYGALVDELLRQRAAAFLDDQQARHQLAAEQAAALASSVRLFAALEANDPEVYKIAGDELRLGEFDFFRLLNTRGEVIPPPADGRAGTLDADALGTPLFPQRSSPEARGEVQLGFIEVQGDAAPRLYRLIAAPIVSFGNRVGTLILGQGVRGLGTTADSRDVQGGLRSALWVNDRLVGGDMSAAGAGALAQALTRSPAAASEIVAGGATYRYQQSLLNPGSAYPPAYLVSVFPLAGLEAEQRSLMQRIVGTAVVVCLVAALLALALSRQLARPVAELVEATRRIRGGEYGHRLGPSSTREMNTLAESFNDMAAGLALKDRYHSVLQQVADPQVAEELVAGRVKLGGELRDVTVMFCDIRQYTALTVGRTPEAVIELLNHHMGAMTRVVQAHGGVINQFAGDAIMALFGAPKSYGTDAERAVRCARAMMEERERLNRDAAVPMQVGIGIASGSMVAGCIGAENRSDYTVVGARVNLAARLASRAAPHEVLVDELTRERIAHVFATEPVPPMTLKGFSEPVRAHRIQLDRSAAA